MFGLAPYKIQVKNSERNLCTLDKFDGKSDFADFVRDYLTSLGSTYEKVDDANKLYQVLQWGQSIDARSITGLIETGEHGYTSRLLDIETSKTSHNRKVTEAEMLPFFFAFFLPHASSHGILILERFKNFGIQKVVTPGLMKAFSIRFPGYKLELAKLVPQTAAKALLEKGEIKGMRFQIERPPSDIADKVRGLSGTSAEADNDTYEFVVRAKRDTSMSKAKAFFDVILGKKSPAQIISIPNWNIGGIKLELEVDGRRRRLDIGNLGTISPVLDVTNEIKTDSSGHPEFEPIWELAAAFAKDLLLELGTDTSKSSLNKKSFTKVAAQDSIKQIRRAGEAK
jgi:hypothetical protein